MNDLLHFYSNSVCDAVFKNLPSIFPEFSWKETSKGFVATNSEFTQSKYGVRADRVVCYKSSGIYIFGDSRPPISWISLASGIDNPKGADWINGVKKLCEMTSVTFPSNGPAPSKKK
jgi:hypothetical protein